MSHFRRALGEAMGHLESADVRAATSAIQRALGFESRGVHTSPDRAPKMVSSEATGPAGLPRRSLAEVVDALRGLRSRFGGSARGVVPTPDIEIDGDPQFTRHHFACDAGSVSYKVYVPASVRNRRPSLVMMLHGCTQDPDDFAQGTRMNRLADQHDLIVVYPQQTRGANAQGCWNWFEARHQRRGAGEPAVLAGLAREIAEDHGIGRERTFVAGLSAGGAMSDVLVSTYPDVFSAAGIHSGLPYGAAGDLVSAFGAMKGHGLRTVSHDGAAGGDVRRIVFHGDADTTVHVSNAEKILDRAAAGIPDAGREITRRRINGRLVTCTTVAATDGTAHTEHWLIHGAGHAWSGAPEGGSYTDSTGPDASREMVRFFLEQ